MSDDAVCATTLTVTDDIGWHLRPASLLAKIAHVFDADIVAERGKRSASAKSLFGIVMLCASGGKRLRVIARGHDARDAIKAIEAGFSTSVRSSGAEGEGQPPPGDQGCEKARHNGTKNEPKEAEMNVRKAVSKLAGKGNAAVITLTCSVMPAAKSVFVAGDFNGWDPQADAMVRRNGHFVKAVKLTPGEHQYKFIIDGEWHVDPLAPTVVSELGTVNNVVRV